MIGKRVRWAHLGADGQPTFNLHGVVEAVELDRDGDWVALLRKDDGRFASCSVKDLAAVDDVDMASASAFAAQDQLNRISAYLTVNALIEARDKNTLATIQRVFETAIKDMSALQAEVSSLRAKGKK